MPLIYLIGSLQEIPRIRQFGRQLRDDPRFANFEIFDDWTGHGSLPDVEFTKFAHERNWSYSRALSSPIVQAVFDVDKKMIDESVAVIMIQPCGKSAALELGYASKDKVTVIVKDNSSVYSKIEIMEKFATIICNSIEDFFQNHVDNFLAKIKQ